MSDGHALAYLRFLADVDASHVLLQNADHYRMGGELELSHNASIEERGGLIVAPNEGKIVGGKLTGVRAN